MTSGIIGQVLLGLKKAPPTLYVGGTTEDAVNRTTYSLSVDIGTEASDRFVVVSTVGLGTNGVTAVTINSVSASEIVAAGGGGGTSIPSALWGATVTSGSGSQTVSVTFAALNNNCAIQAWALFGLGSTTPYHTNSNTTAAATSLSTTLNIPQDGIAIGWSGINNDGSGGQTWTGLGEVVDDQVESITYSGASSSGMTAETGRTITCAGSGSVLRRIVAASWV